VRTAQQTRLFIVLSLLAFGPLACSSNPEQSGGPPAGTTAAPAPEGEQPHGNHDPHHGGVVLMDRDVHFEVVMKPDGEYRVYFTDAVRKPLPASTVQDVVITVTCPDEKPEVIGLQMDDKGESWVGKAHHEVHDPEATVRTSYVYRDQPYWIDLPVKVLQNPPAKADHGDDHGGKSSH
jgi:hypothetical protein